MSDELRAGGAGARAGRAAEPPPRSRSSVEPQPAGADPLRQLGDPPERRRGHARRPPHDPPRRPHGQRLVDGRRRVGVPGARRAHRRRGAAGARSTPAGPALAPPRRSARSPPLDPATAARLAGRSGRPRQGVRRRRRWAGDRRLLPDQPLVGRLRQLGRPGRRRRRAPTSAWRASPGGRAATASPGRRRAGWPTSTVPCSAPAPRPRPTPASTRSSCRPTATRSCSSRRPSPTSSRRSAVYGFNAKAVAERRSFVRLGDDAVRPAPSTSSTTRPAPGSAYDAEGTPRRRLVLVDGGTTVALTHDRRTAADGRHDVDRPRRRVGGVRRHRPAPRPARRRRAGAVAAEVDGPVVDSATAELVAGVERGVLVTDFWYTRVLDPRTLADHRADPQRRVADRARRGDARRCATSASRSPTPRR